MAVYAILPTMKGANFDRLVQGLEEMKEYYKEQGNRFSGHFLWFSTFLYRSKTISEDEKEEVRKKMKEIGSLHEGNPLLEELKAEGREEGKEEGKAEGKAEGLQEAVVTFIETRFPPLTELAREKVPQITKVDKLDLLLRGVYTAPDEATARLLLDLAA